MGTTIGQVIISYDIEKNHTAVKKAMEALGYMDNWQNPTSKKSYDMPNTTLWHKEKSSDQAMVDLKKVCTDEKANLEKAVAVLKSEHFVGYPAKN